MTETLAGRADGLAEVDEDMSASLRAPRHRLWTLVKKELWSYFVSPVSYLIFLLFYLFRVLEVMRLVYWHSRAGDADMFVAQYFQTGSTQFAVIMIPPILTMRAFAEEKRTGSFELLMTVPFHDHEVVLGKWLASWIFYAFLWVPALLVLFVLQSPLFLDTSFHFGQILACYVGLFSLGSLLLAVGLFTSSLTDNQLLASLASMLFGLGLLVLPYLYARAPAYEGLDVDKGFLAVLLDQAYVHNHLWLWFFRGLIDTGHIVFYLSTTALFLFLTVRVVEARRWR